MGESREECEEMRRGLAGYGDELRFIPNATGGDCSIISSMTWPDVCSNIPVAATCYADSTL